MTLKSSKKKFKTSLILFIIALVSLVAGILFIVFGEKIGLGTTGNIIFSVAIAAYMVLMNVSLLLNWLYRKNCIIVGASSTALYVFQFIFLAPEVILFAALLVYALMHGIGVQGSENLKKIKIRDENGNEFILTQLYEGSNDYKDQNGDIWTTRDGGITFECVSKIRLKDKEGDEYTLTPKSEFASTDYTDQNGDTWQEFNTFNTGNPTYERKPKVKDADGNVYELTKSSEFGDLYTDQHGHWWRSSDGGKTFKKE